MSRSITYVSISGDGWHAWGQSMSIAVLWRRINWRTLLPLLVGGALGLPFGVSLLLHLGDHDF